MSILSRRSPGLKLLRMHGGPTFFETGHRFQMLKERWAFHVADELCAVSHTVADGTRRMLGLGQRPIEVIYNPIETRLFSPSPEDPPEEDGFVMFAGTIAERKGIRQLIQAMPMIVAAVPHARLEVYGGEVIEPVPPQPLAQELMQLLPSEVASHVIWKGRVPRTQLPIAIRRASVCVYPSFFEAMPIAWLEGLAAGKAVVASRTGPGPEIIEDGVTGLLCDPHHPETIADAVIRLLKDADLRQRLGAEARQMVHERYEQEPIIDRNEAYYRKLAGVV